MRGIREGQKIRRPRPFLRHRSFFRPHRFVHRLLAPPPSHRLEKFTMTATKFIYSVQT